MSTPAYRVLHHLDPDQMKLGYRAHFRQSSISEARCLPRRVCPMSKKPQPPRPNEDAALGTSCTRASTQDDLQERRQVIYEYAAALRGFVARLPGEPLH